jgi:hypothetical protein
LLTNNLLRKVLLEPAAYCDTLIAASGYVSGPMALRHVFGNAATGTAKLPSHVKVQVVYGMYSIEGVSRSDHKVFNNISAMNPNFQMLYYSGKPPLHAKIYAWLKSGEPTLAFVGSANYSVASFYGTWQECVAEADPVLAVEYVLDIIKSSVPSRDVRSPTIKTAYLVEGVPVDELSHPFDEMIERLECVNLPLFIEGAERIHQRAGLNWGQRPGRDPNQAYIPVPAVVALTGFFPPRGEWFTVLTDDGKTFECAIAQDNDKAIETPLSNAILGLYFRKRLGVPSGALVTLQDLDNYGRRHVRICKADESRYLMDFRQGD